MSRGNREAEDGVGIPDPGGPAEEPDAGGGFRDRMRAGARYALGPGAFAAALVAVAGGAVVVDRVVGLPGAALAGVLAAGFVYGTLSRARRYAETGLAGALVGAGTALSGATALTLLGVGLPWIAVGAAGGLAASVGGHYLGRDLRAGLTRSL